MQKDEGLSNVVVLESCCGLNEKHRVHQDDTRIETNVD